MKKMYNIIIKCIAHFKKYWLLWTALLFMLVLLLFSASAACFYVCVAVFAVSFIFRPQKSVYAIVGTSGSLLSFMFSFVAIIVAFSVIYYFLFFRNMGVSSDSSAVLIEPELFSNVSSNDSVLIKPHSSILYEEKKSTDSIIRIHFDTIIQTTFDTIHYHRVGFGLVLENTLLSSLQQGPTTFFYSNSIFGECSNSEITDNPNSRLFSTLLLLQIFISWIFLGVFISLLYSKFRYEA